MSKSVFVTLHSIRKCLTDSLSPLLSEVVCAAPVTPATGGPGGGGGAQLLDLAAGATSQLRLRQERGEAVPRHLDTIEGRRDSRSYI